MNIYVYKCIYVYMFIVIHVYICINDIQIVYHNPCFSLFIFIFHNNKFDNQVRQTKATFFLRFDILSFTKTLFL